RMMLTELTIKTLRPYDDDIVSAVGNGEICLATFVNDEESIASYCRVRGSHGQLSIMGILPFPNDGRAFRLLKWIPSTTLIGLADEISQSDVPYSITGIKRSGPYKGTKFELGVKAILNFKSAIPSQAIREHIALRHASHLVRKYLEAKDIFHLHRAQLLNSWNANIQVDMYGRRDIRKIARAFGRILHADFSPWEIRFPAEVTNMLLLTQSYLEHADSPASTNDGRGFEIFCRDTLIAAGWHVEPTVASGDYGGDLVAERDGLRWCIQCKDTARPSGVKAIQQAAGAAGYYACDYAAVVSRNGFTDQAILLAARLKVILLNEHSVSHMGDLHL